MGLKYVMIDDGIPIVFSDALVHADVASGFSKSMITGAGFVGKDADGSFYAYGESLSLGIKSKPTDTKVIKRVLS